MSEEQAQMHKAMLMAQLEQFDLELVRLTDLYKHKPSYYVENPKGGEGFIKELKSYRGSLLKMVTVASAYPEDVSDQLREEVLGIVEIIYDTVWHLELLYHLLSTEDLK